MTSSRSQIKAIDVLIEKEKLLKSIYLMLEKFEKKTGWVAHTGVIANEENIKMIGSNFVIGEITICTAAHVPDNYKLGSHYADSIKKIENNIKEYKTRKRK